MNPRSFTVYLIASAFVTFMWYYYDSDAGLGALGFIIYAQLLEMRERQQ